jgi:hypothetical protein
MVPWLHGVEPVVATPFDIRHDADELLDDLSNHRGENEVLLERVQALLAAHGDSMIAKGELCAPWRSSSPPPCGSGSARSSPAFKAAAGRKLHELESSNASEADLRHSRSPIPARRRPSRPGAASPTAPGTPGAWGSTSNAPRGRARARSSSCRTASMAASRLLAPERSPELPLSLDGLEEMWHIEVPRSSRPSPTARAMRSAARAARRGPPTASCSPLAPAT